MFTKIVRKIAQIKINNGHCGNDGSGTVTGHCY